MAKCLEQFATAEPAAHHRITRWFMDTSFPGNMRSDFDKMLKGEGMTPRLKAAVESLQWVPLDDCVCEGPHAAAKRVKTPATAATWGLGRIDNALGAEPARLPEPPNSDALLAQGGVELLGYSCAAG